jgi:hypothetical protein
MPMTMEAYAEVPDDVTRAALKKLGDSLGGHGVLTAVRSAVRG